MGRAVPGKVLNFVVSIEQSTFDCLLIPDIKWPHFARFFENCAVQTKMVAVCFLETPTSIYQLTQLNVS